MEVLLHLDPEEPSRLLGLWVAPIPDGSDLAVYYPPGPPELVKSAAWTLAEKVEGVSWPAYFRQLVGRIPTEIWWEATVVEATDDLESLFVSLSAEVLASAAAWHGAIGGDANDELQFTAKMPPPALADGLRRRKDMPMKSLDRDLLRQYDVCVASDDPFQQRARLLQSLWRNKKNLPLGTRNNKEGGEPLGSRLPAEAASSSLDNFLSETIKQRVKADVEGPHRDRDALFGKPRIYCDLLSSQPLCFNLFAELDANRELASEVFAELLPGAVERVTSIKFEFSPGRGSPKYLSNRSAFDVYVEHTIPNDGGLGFIGIEVKYHENMKVAKASMDGKPYGTVADVAGCFDPESIALVEEPPLQQIWLDHLLALSMLRSDKHWAQGRFVVLAPALNLRCAKVVHDYRRCLSEESTFDSWILEDVHAAIAQRSDAAWVGDFYKRYLDFDRIDTL